jgi:hypothetical protein
MLGLWLQDLESLEAISQDEDTRRIVLRMAAMTQAGTLGEFLVQLASDSEVDDETKGSLAELARDRAFLFAVDDYFHRTQRYH